MSNTSTILITGAHGFIGTSLVNYFSNKGWKVYALVHHIPKSSSDTILKRKGEIYTKYDSDIHYVKYSLEKGVVDESVFVDVDYIVHCAYMKDEKKSNAFQINIAGSKRLLELSRKYDVKKNVFLSSMSAQKDSPSIYGKQKFAIEKLFNSSQDVVVRPGLVIGNGGLVKDMIEFIKKRKVIPLVSGGKQPIQTIYINDLVLSVDKILEKNLKGTFTVSEPEAITYKQFYKEVCSVFNINAKFISVPYSLFYVAIVFADALRIHLAVSKDSLVGLKNLKAHEVKNTLAQIGISPKSYNESLLEIKSAGL